MRLQNVSKNVAHSGGLGKTSEDITTNRTPAAEALTDESRAPSASYESGLIGFKSRPRHQPSFYSLDSAPRPKPSAKCLQNWRRFAAVQNPNRVFHWCWTQVHVALGRRRQVLVPGELLTPGLRQATWRSSRARRCSSACRGRKRSERPSGVSSAGTELRSSIICFLNGPNGAITWR